MKLDKENVTHLDILAWKDSENIWKKRSSCVSFVKIARHGKHTDTILKIADTCVKHKERFVQLGNGYVFSVIVYVEEPQTDYWTFVCVVELFEFISGGYWENCF